MSDNIRRVAFTLAEVLITLGIIGIVAALTIPTLIAKYQKKEFASRLSQTFSILSQAVKLAQVDYGDIQGWVYQAGYHSTISTDEWLNGGQENLITSFVKKYFIPYLRISKDLGYNRLMDVGYDKGFVRKDGTSIHSGGYSYYVVVLNNGVYVFFYYNHNSHSAAYPEGTTLILDPMITVDVNGKSGPNIIGRDIYAFELSTAANKFQPFGANHAFDISGLKTVCDDLGAGSLGPYYCAALIQKLGWKITDDYPWD